MQKGKSLEKYLDYLVNIVNTNGGHAHKNHTLRSSKGAPVKNHGEPFDYEFFTRTSLVCIDAKECSGNSLNIKSFLAKKSNAKQVENFKRISALDYMYECGFLIFFVNRAHSLNICDCLRFIEINNFISIYRNGEKSLTPHHGRAFNPDILTVKCCPPGTRPRLLMEVWDFLPNSKKEDFYYERLQKATK